MCHQAPIVLISIDGLTCAASSRRSLHCRREYHTDDSLEGRQRAVTDLAQILSDAALDNRRGKGTKIKVLSLIHEWDCQIPLVNEAVSGLWGGTPLKSTRKLAMAVDATKLAQCSACSQRRSSD